MQTGKATIVLLLAITAGAMGSLPAQATDRVNSSSWLSFYESLADLKKDLSQAQSLTLDEDLRAIDAYYLGRYLDGIDAEDGDLPLREALAGLNPSEIHLLAEKYKSYIDKMSHHQNQNITK